jgi:hypothetical protein
VQIEAHHVKSKPRKSRIRAFVIGLSGLVAVLFVAYAGFLFVSSWKLEKAVEELRQVARASSYEPSRANGSDSVDVNDPSMAYSELFAELERIDASMDAYKAHYGNLTFDDILKGPALRTTAEQRMHDDWDQAEERRKEAVVTEHEAFILAFRDLTKLEGLVIPPGGSFQENPRYPYFSSLREVARLLVKHAELAAARGDYEEAVEDIIAGLRFSDALALDDSMFVQLIRHPIVGIVLTGAEESLGSGEILSDRTLVLLMDQAAHSAKQQHLPYVIAVDAMHGRELFDRSRRGDAAPVRALFDAYDWGEKAGKGMRGEEYHPERLQMHDVGRAVFVKFYTSPLARPWVDRDEQIYIEMYVKASRLACLPYQDATSALNQLERESPQPLLQMAGITSSITGSLTSQANSIARLDMLRIGFSIERFFAKHGVYPQDLNEIASILGTGIPTDPFTGEPYRYTLNGDSFLLYSVGKDLEDDGGRHDYFTGDVVWRGQ